MNTYCSAFLKLKDMKWQFLVLIKILCCHIVNTKKNLEPRGESENYSSKSKISHKKFSIFMI